MNYNSSLVTSQAEQELVFTKLASLVYQDKAAYTPAAVNIVFWQVLSGMCTNQFHVREEPSHSIPEASVSELSSEEQQVVRLDSMLLHLLLPILRHAIKMFMKASGADVKIVGKGAASFCVAKLAIMLKGGHPASQDALISELWQSGKCWHFAHTR